MCSRKNWQSGKRILNLCHYDDVYCKDLFRSAAQYRRHKELLKTISEATNDNSVGYS